MCGIAGIVSSNSRLISEERIRAAARCLQHRGQGQEALWINTEQTVAFGHQRLAILDLSEGAAQPMHCLDRYCLVHNGEIYNYVELKEQLQQKGYRFDTTSDTEVLAAAYDAWGSDCLQRFDGMFAFAIWDEKEHKVFAARDRFGEKPFFFYYDGEQFLFASEIKSFWGMGIRKEVNQSLLYNFLSIGYTSNPADPEESFFVNISKLPAASFLVYDLASEKLEIEKYWQVYPEINFSIGKEEAIEKFQCLFSESIQKRLRSDVPIGTSLSGGLDSSAIVAFCDGLSSGNYTHKCFTASFTGFEKDETDKAREVAAQFGLQHFLASIDQQDLVSLMDKVMHQQDEPFGSASVLAQYGVYGLARQQSVTVLLDGQGADEILGGYHKYYRWYWQELFRKRQLKKSAELQKARVLGITESFGSKHRLAALFPEFAAGILQTRKAKQAFHHPDLNRDFAFSHKRELYYSTPASFDLNGALYFNTFVNGLEELLRLADRNSMAHTTEVRLPFLSHELVEFLFTLPPQFKIRDGWSKWLLRKSVENKLPQSIVWQRGKTGFEPPQEKWMQQPAVSEAILEGKKKLVEQGILNEQALKKVEPHTAYAAQERDWLYWSASYLL